MAKYTSTLKKQRDRQRKVSKHKELRNQYYQKNELQKEFGNKHKKAFLNQITRENLLDAYKNKVPVTCVGTVASMYRDGICLKNVKVTYQKGNKECTTTEQHMWLYKDFLLNKNPYKIGDILQCSGTLKSYQRKDESWDIGLDQIFYIKGLGHVDLKKKKKKKRKKTTQLKANIQTNNDNITKISTSIIEKNDKTKSIEKEEKPQTILDLMKQTPINCETCMINKTCNRKFCILEQIV